jgi:hypothetical protein
MARHRIDTLGARILSAVIEYGLNDVAAIAGLGGLDRGRANETVTSLIDQQLLIGVDGGGIEVVGSAWGSLRATPDGRRSLNDWDDDSRRPEELEVLRAVQRALNRPIAANDIAAHVTSALGLEANQILARLIVTGDLAGTPHTDVTGKLWLVEIHAITAHGRQRLDPTEQSSHRPGIRIGRVDHFSGNLVAGDHNTVTATTNIERLGADELVELRRLVTDLHNAVDAAGFTGDVTRELQPLVHSLEVQLAAPSPPRRRVAATFAIIKELTVGAAGNGVWAGLLYAIDQIVSR